MELNKAGFALASGSACSSHSSEISPTLKAMGISEELAYGAVRLSLGLDNTVEECDEFITSLEKIVLRLNNLVSLTV
jgi:cysteine desulfurase